MSSAAGAPALPHAPALSPAFAATVLAMLLGLQPLTTDLYLPALPMLARDLAAPMPQVQLTMSALILSFGIAQLVWGPVADRFGRRPVLLAGLALYALASVGAALAANIAAVVAWRVVQGAAMSAAVVCARAMVRDLYQPHEGAHVMSRALSGLGVIAIASPVLGGLVASALGWRATMVTVALVGVGLLAFVGLRLPETAPPSGAPPTWGTQLRTLAGQIGQTLRHRGFQAWALLVACTYGALFIYLASAGFVFVEVLGLPAWQAGAAMATTSLAYIAGTFWCRRLLPRHGLAGSVVRAAGFTLAGGLAMAVLAWLEVRSVWAVIVPQMVFAIGHGVHQPCGQAGAVGPFPRWAGVASALAGFILALVAFGIGQWLGRAMDGTARPMALGIGAWSVATALVAWTLVRRHGDSAAVPSSAR